MGNWLSFLRCTCNSFSFTNSAHRWRPRQLLYRTSGPVAGSRYKNQAAQLACSEWRPRCAVPVSSGKEFNSVSTICGFVSRKSGKEVRFWLVVAKRSKLSLCRPTIQVVLRRLDFMTQSGFDLRTETDRVIWVSFELFHERRLVGCAESHDRHRMSSLIPKQANGWVLTTLINQSIFASIFCCLQHLPCQRLASSFRFSSSSEFR